MKILLVAILASLPIAAHAGDVRFTYRIMMKDDEVKEYQPQGSKIVPLKIDQKKWRCNIATSVEKSNITGRAGYGYPRMLIAQKPHGTATSWNSPIDLKIAKPR